MIFLEILDNGRVHVAELAAVALVEDDDKMLPERRVAFVFAHKNIKLLDRCDDDPRVGVFHLPLQDGGAGVAVGRLHFQGGNVPKGQRG